MNVPNALSLLRIALIPCFVVLYYLPLSWTHLAAGALVGLAAVTDWMDGYLARRLSQTSKLGAFLDPVADKLIVAVVLIVLLQQDPRVVLALPVAVIIGREIAISALREWMAELGARQRVAVSFIGKAKTACQMTALILMVIRDPLFGLPLYTIGFVALYLATAMTLWSMLVYLAAAWPELRRHRGGVGSRP